MDLQGGTTAALLDPRVTYLGTYLTLSTRTPINQTYNKILKAQLVVPLGSTPGPMLRLNDEYNEINRVSKKKSCKKTLDGKTPGFPRKPFFLLLNAANLDT